MTTYLFTITKRTNSTYQPSLDDGLQVEGIIKEVGFDIDNPVILYSSITPTYNYLYAVELGRYYYIRWTYNKGMWEAHCELDAPASFKTQIGNTTAYVKYSSSNYSTLLKDDRVTAKHGALHVTKDYALLGLSSTGCYVISVISENNNGINGACASYAVTAGNLQGLCVYLLSENFLDSVWIGIRDFFQNPMDCIVSCKWIPCDINIIQGTSTSIVVGYHDTGISGKLINYNFSSSGIAISLNKRDNNIDSFLDCEPFSTSTLYLPFVGVVPFDNDSFYPTSSVYLNYAIDVVTGDIVYSITKNQTDKNPLATYSGNASVDIPLSTQKADVKSMGTGIVTAIGGVVATVVTKDPSKLALGLAASAGAEIVGSKISTQTNGSISSRVGVNLGIKASLTTYRLTTSESPFGSTRISTLGLPLEQVVTINTLNGYVECVDASVSTGWKHINDLLNTMMNGGFYYE